MAIILAIMIIAVIFTTLASFGKKERSLEALSVLFLLFFFPLWAFSLWVPNMGPTWNGVAFLDLFVFALFLTLLIFTVSSMAHGKRNDRSLSHGQLQVEGDNAAVKRSYGMALLIFVAFMILFIIVGSMRQGI